MSWGAQNIGGVTHGRLSVRMTAEQLDEIRREAKRIDRSISWVVQQSWQIAREKVKAMPTSLGFEEGQP